ncbi:MAG: hypothetical protein M0Q91_05430 [Methanoregula sp.]|nr:hypothetical protein [Methanoregula sp.]
MPLHCEDNPEIEDCFLECTLCFPVIDEMRRYLYRNVACEARKISDIQRHMPQVPGWS